MSILMERGSVCYFLGVKNTVLYFLWVVVRSDACGVAWGSYGGSVPFDFGPEEAKILPKIDHNLSNKMNTQFYASLMPAKTEADFEAEV